MPNYGTILRRMPCGPDWPPEIGPLISLGVLLGLRAAPKEDHTVSVAELLYGAPLALPGKLLESKELPAVEFLENLRRRLLSFPHEQWPICCPHQSL